ncbi:hypothetical protein [Streptomyces sp. NPDC018045]|uniref:hypothetical protein n=1 Tax=Streptomyces sp. NPDC018045 TaxID=3365037 RepID=UPI0037BE0E4B
MPIMLRPPVVVLASQAKVLDLVAAVENSSFVAPPESLLMTAGVSVSKLFTREVGHYFEVVLTDLATLDCIGEVGAVFEAEGLPLWRNVVIDVTQAMRPHPHFPGSKRITYMIVHPEAHA